MLAVSPLFEEPFKKFRVELEKRSTSLVVAVPRNLCLSVFMLAFLCLCKDVVCVECIQVCCFLEECEQR